MPFERYFEIVPSIIIMIVIVYISIPSPRTKERNHKLMPIIDQTKYAYNSNNLFKNKNNNLEEGIECFSNWLSIEEGNEENKKNVHLILSI